MQVPSKKDRSIHEDYEIGQIIGKGGFSEVKLATEKKTGKNWAAKIISKKAANKSGEAIEGIWNEIFILKSVEHKNIVELHEVYEDNQNYYIILENISGGELFDRIIALTTYSEKDASNVIRQILEGLQHLHERNIAHRDLKPENLLLSSPSADADIKITDFGLSEIQQSLHPGEEMKMAKAVGTPSYIAPEVLQFLSTGQPYGKQIDLWGVGCILYILLCGFPPFYGDDDDEMYDKIEAGDYSFPSPDWDCISSEAINLIKNLLNLNPDKRYTASEALKDPWIVGGASEAHLPQTLTALKKFNARRKFRGAIKAITAIKRMSFSRAPKK
jgi:serine/threonine protein kinase